MSRVLPADVAPLVRPVPDDFLIAFDDHGHYVVWTAILTVTDYGPVNVELGFSRAGGRANEKQERVNLREGAWQVTELARLGRIDLLSFCMVDRHKRAAGKAQANGAS